MDYIVCFLYKYGLIAIFSIILIEYACFPISSEIVLPFSGVVAHMSKIDIRLLVLLSIIAGVIGSCICYIIGMLYGERCLRWIEKKIPSSKVAIDKSEVFFRKYGNAAVLIGRVIPLCRTYISFVAGVFRQPILTFVFFSSIGIAIWNIVLIMFGYMLGDKWECVIDIYNHYKHFIIGIFVVVIMIIITKSLIVDRRK